MRLAIADPPYPLELSERYDLAAGGARIVSRSRGRRWYGGGPAAADYHPEAEEWDDPARHRRLLEQLLDEYDGWAIATSSDGLQAYGELPAPARVLAWVKPRSAPGGHRIHRGWEPVILYPPRGRRSRTSGMRVPDVLVEPAPGDNSFAGSKPTRWTRWVLDCLGFDSEVDVVDDLFPGSGSVAKEAAWGTLL